MKTDTLIITGLSLTVLVVVSALILHQSREQVKPGARERESRGLIVRYDYSRNIACYESETSTGISCVKMDGGK